MDPKLYGQTVWRQIPLNCIVVDGRIYPTYDEVSCAEAARTLGMHRCTVAKMCDEGTLKEGDDWRRMGDRGQYLIRRASLVAFAKSREVRET